MASCRFVSLIVFTFFSYSNLLAQEFDQLPVDEPALNVDQAEFAGWERNILFGYSLSRGNSDNSLLNLLGRIGYEGNRNVARFEGETNYGKDDDDTNEDASRALAEYRRLLSRYVFVGFGTSFERDQLAALKYRVFLNPSVGRYIYRTPKLRWLVEGGPSYVFEEQGAERDDYLAPRVGQRMELSITETTKLFQEVYSSWKSSSDYLITSQLGIDVAINSVLGLVLTARNDFDSSPAEQKKKNDLSLITSVRASF